MRREIASQPYVKPATDEYEKEGSHIQKKVSANGCGV